MTDASQDGNAAAPLAMTIFRSLTGVIVGVIVAVGSAYLFYRIAFAILLQMNDQIFVDFPTGFYVATLGYDLVAGLLGGFGAAWISGRRQALHGTLVGMALVGLTYWTSRAATGEEPKWFYPGAMIVALVGAAAGGALRAALARRSPAAPDPASAN